MTRGQRPSPEELAAFADGQLAHEAAVRIEAALAEDPELRKQVEAHQALRDRLKARFDPIIEEPVPERLLALLGSEQPRPAGAEIIDLATARRERRPWAAQRRWARPVGWAIAASLVVAVIGVGLRSGADYASGDVAGALDKQLAATQPRDARVRILLSFRDQAGQFCRGFSSASRAGIACRDKRGWKIAKSFPGSSVVDSQFRQAGAVAPDMMAAIQAMSTGEALDADGEAEAMRQGWH